MPTYLAPGVYVEELAGPRTIQGVSTSTAAFVGPCRSGPVSGRPELITSFLDFQRIYGDLLDLDLNGGVPNYLALGVKGFFDEGGSSLYVRRIFAASAAPDDDTASGASGGLTVRARFPGRAGAMTVTFTLVVGSNVLVQPGAAAQLTRVRNYDVVYASNADASDAGLFVAHRDETTGAWSLAGGSLTLADAVRVLPLSVQVDIRRPTLDALGLPAFGAPETIGIFGLDPRSPNGITSVLVKDPSDRTRSLTLPIWIDTGSALPDPADDTSGHAIATALLGTTMLGRIGAADAHAGEFTISLLLAHGTDGGAPVSSAYEEALVDLESIDDISTVAAPGAASAWGRSDASTYVPAVNAAVTGHCERMLYRVAALDTPAGLSPTDALEFRNLRSSDHAALYYPWIVIPSPVDGTPLPVPPAAYLAGIWARSDNAYGVIKAPANTVVRSAVDFERRLNKAQQELLNPQGVNCLRYFPGPGFLVWGARTISEDPEWKYLSMRRYFNYVEKSIDEGTQWVVFEINGPTLWDSVRHTIEGFLLTEWRSGALLGRKPEEAYFVTCDATTMTQDDLDNGRLICRIGIAAAKPAEFVIFRISQWTATATA